MTRQETESIELTYIIGLVSNDRNTEVNKALFLSTIGSERRRNHPLNRSRRFKPWLDACDKNGFLLT